MWSEGSCEGFPEQRHDKTPRYLFLGYRGVFQMSDSDPVPLRFYDPAAMTA